jgi:hypothetical protein
MNTTTSSTETDETIAYNAHMEQVMIEELEIRVKSDRARGLSYGLSEDTLKQHEEWLRRNTAEEIERLCKNQISS